MEYFIKEKGFDDETQMKRNKITSIRIGKITDVLYEKKPSDLLPFKGKFPIVDPLDANAFLKRTMKHHFFEELPNDIKLATRRAEKVKWLHDRFYDYLKDEGIGVEQFKAKNPKTKQDILFDFLFSNKMDLPILEV